MQTRKLDTEISCSDHILGALCRLGSFRNRYKSAPGLYRIGSPSEKSPVLVTANYRLTLDSLRARLGGRDLWVLVLDTQGINVWCAAGKGTFGTQTLIGAVRKPGPDCPHLNEIVSHRELILPQLGAPGIAAHEIRKETGFKVIYGPVLARDLPAFLDDGPIPPGHTACGSLDPESRRVPFELQDRAVLIPIEIGNAQRFARKWLARISTAGALVALAGGQGFPAAVSAAIQPLRAFAAAVLGGAVAFPVLLPWLPGRWFSVKGILPGLAAALLARTGRGPFGKAGLGLLTVAGSSFLALEFTGATPFTGPSGVSRELLKTAPAYAAALAISLSLYFLSLVRDPSGEER